MPSLSGAQMPSTVAMITPVAIAGIRPIRSATIDQGTTAAASPSVAADTLRAADAGPIRRSEAICGRTAWVA